MATLLPLWWLGAYFTLSDQAQSLSGKCSQATPARQGVALSEKEKSHQFSCCLKLDCHTQLLQYSVCQSVWYCSVRCQKAHWPKHKVLCKAIKELFERESFKEKGLGDAQDRGAYASHNTPRQQERIVKLVARKYLADCYLDYRATKVLWDTGPQVSTVSVNLLKSRLPTVQIRDIKHLLGTDGSIRLQAAYKYPVLWVGGKWCEVNK